MVQHPVQRVTTLLAIPKFFRILINLRISLIDIAKLDYEIFKSFNELQIVVKNLWQTKTSGIILKIFNFYKIINSITIRKLIFNYFPFCCCIIYNNVLNMGIYIIISN